MIIVLLLAAVLGMASCDDYNDWTTSSGALLTFSRDTVDFGTIVTDQSDSLSQLGVSVPIQSSATQTLVVRNRNKAGLRISRVALAGGAESPFRVNVDGEYLADGEGSDFQVFARDSIYIRMEVALPYVDGEETVHREDQLVFTLESGQVQSIPLVVDGMNVQILKAPVISEDTTLGTDRPYLIYDSLVIAPGVTLTLPAGCTLMMHDGVSIDVHGTLVAQGAVDSPVTFRGDRLDNMFDYLPYDNTPNRWGGIHIHSDSRDNYLEQCDIHGGDYGIICDSTAWLEGYLAGDAQLLTSLVMYNSVIHNVGGVGLQLTNCCSEVYGTQISNTLGRCVDIFGGGHQFTHCTIAQYYPFDADRGDALYVSNYQSDGDVYCPLYYCYFLNSVITGYADDVIMGSVAETEVYPCDYYFGNCFLRTVVPDDAERYSEVVYDLDDYTELRGSDNFELFDTDNFLYRFVPVENSSIRGLANPTVAASCPFDRYGVSRLADGAPDAGAYEAVVVVKD